MYGHEPAPYICRLQLLFVSLKHPALKQKADRSRLFEILFILRLRHFHHRWGQSCDGSAQYLPDREQCLQFPA